MMMGPSPNLSVRKRAVFGRMTILSVPLVDWLTKTGKTKKDTIIEISNLMSKSYFISYYILKGGYEVVKSFFPSFFGTFILDVVFFKDFFLHETVIPREINFS